MATSTSIFGDVGLEPRESYLFFLTIVLPWSEVISRRGLSIEEKHLTIYEMSGALRTTFEKPKSIQIIVDVLPHVRTNYRIRSPR